MADVARSTRTRLVGSWTQSDRPSDANQRGSTGSPTWIRPSICAPDGMDADGGGAALVDRGGDSITSLGLVADTLAEAAGVVSRDDGLVGVAAQAPTEIATKAATLAPTTTDGYRMERLLGSGCHGERPTFEGKGSISSAGRT
jgi:hypothetical protein